jgi:hypothetical protein
MKPVRASGKPMIRCNIALTYAGGCTEDIQRGDTASWLFYNFELEGIE